MKFIKLLESLYSCEKDLQKYIIIFNKNQDLQNAQEAQKVASALNEFLDIYLQLEEEKKEEFYSLVTLWTKDNTKYMNLFKNLYESYLLKDKN